jgi:hypothetical protein
MNGERGDSILQRQWWVYGAAFGDASHRDEDEAIEFKLTCERWIMADSSLPGAEQIIEPQEPDSASTRPNGQKACAAWNVFKEEVINRQEQHHLQRYFPLIRSAAAPTKTHWHSQLPSNRKSVPAGFCPSWSTNRRPSMLTIGSSVSRLLR